MAANARGWFYNPEAVRETRANGKPGRLLGATWDIPTEPSGSKLHTATYPRELARRCILLGSADKCCSACLQPYQPDIEEGEVDLEWQRECGGNRNGTYHGRDLKPYEASGAERPADCKESSLRSLRPRTVKGWLPDCACGVSTQPCTILDPFAGSGTTGIVALQHGRNFIGMDLHPDYCAETRDRLANALRPTEPRAKERLKNDPQLSLFAEATP
jgi:hypothetical protein